MSSKKIWAASLAAVIAGSTFAVVASAANSDKEEVTPGLSVSGQAEAGDAKIAVNASNGALLNKDACKCDGSVITIKPMNKGAYDNADSTKTNLNLYITSDTIKGLAKKDIINLKGAEFVAIDGNVLTLIIKDYDVKATVGTETKVEFSANTNDGVKDYAFTIKNDGQLTEPTMVVKPGKYVTKVDDKKQKDVIIVVYDATEVGKNMSNRSRISVMVSGAGKVNGTTVDMTETEVTYGEMKNAGVTSSSDYSTCEFTLQGVSDPANNSGVDTTFNKKLTFRFMSEEDYANLKIDANANEGDGGTITDATPSDADTSSTSSDTVVEKEVTVDVAVGDVTDAGLVLDPAKIFTGDAATASWADVQEIKFTSDKPFALVFSVEKGAVKDKADAETFTKGVDAYKALDKAALANEQTLTAEDAAHVAKSTAKTVTLQTAEGETATVKATVKVKVKTTDTAPNTGIALAIAPAALATAFVTVAAVMSKKKKG